LCKICTNFWQFRNSLNKWAHQNSPATLIWSMIQLGEPLVQHLPLKEATECLYRSDTVCTKGYEGDF